MGATTPADPDPVHRRNVTLKLWLDPHRYFNMTDEPVRFLFGIAPSYLPNGGA